MQSKAQFVGGDPLRAAIWEAMKAKASYVMTIAGDEKLLGDVTLSENEVAMAEVQYAAEAVAKTEKEKEPYGSVHYCDPGWRDGVKRFPCDTRARTKAAWSYSHHKSIMAHYTSAQLAKLHACIEAAYRKFFGEAPPSAKS